MYLNHFGLQEAPFGLTPNTGFYYGLPRTRRRCRYSTGRWRRGGLHQGDRRGRHRQDPALPQAAERTGLRGAAGASGLVAQPHLNPAELRIALALELGLAVRDQSELDLTDRIHRHLIALHQQGSRVVVLIDEAQALPDETLEAIRLFGNLETESSKLLQIVLFGQPELDARLAKPYLRQLRQRIGFSYCLRPLRFDETRAYLEHRLQISGYRGAPLFGGRALRQLWRASRGIPRLINILAQKCLMLAYGQGARQIDSRLVRLAVRDTDDARRFVARRWWPLVLLLGCALAYGVWQ